MRKIDASEVWVCLTCAALVPRYCRADHEQWHDRIAAVAIETTARLDKITGRTS